jgi:hypothetical protein
LACCSRFVLMPVAAGESRSISWLAGAGRRSARRCRHGGIRRLLPRGGPCRRCAVGAARATRRGAAWISVRPGRRQSGTGSSRGLGRCRRAGAGACRAEARQRVLLTALERKAALILAGAKAVHLKGWSSGGVETGQYRRPAKTGNCGSRAGAVGRPAARRAGLRCAAGDVGWAGDSTRAGRRASVLRIGKGRKYRQKNQRQRAATQSAHPILRYRWPPRRRRRSRCRDRPRLAAGHRADEKPGDSSNFVIRLVPLSNVHLNIETETTSGCGESVATTFAAP